MAKSGGRRRRRRRRRANFEIPQNRANLIATLEGRGIEEDSSVFLGKLIKREVKRSTGKKLTRNPPRPATYEDHPFYLSLLHGLIVLTLLLVRRHRPWVTTGHRTASPAPQISSVESNVAAAATTTARTAIVMSWSRLQIQTLRNRQNERTSERHREGLSA